MLSITPTVEACACAAIGDGNPRSALHQSRSAFVGDVMEVRAATQSEVQAGPHSVFFSVARYWKGVKNPEITVYAGRGGGTPFSIEIAQKFFVYAHGKELLITGTRTTLDNASEDLRILGKAKIRGPIAKKLKQQAVGLLGACKIKSAPEARRRFHF